MLAGIIASSVEKERHFTARIIKDFIAGYGVVEGNKLYISSNMAHQACRDLWDMLTEFIGDEHQYEPLPMSSENAEEGN